MNGIMIAAGDDIRPNTTVSTLDLVDVAPTILDGMGYDAPTGMVGHSFGRRLGLSG
jgi:arylsulfatase A-like enzyme